MWLQPYVAQLIATVAAVALAASSAVAGGGRPDPMVTALAALLLVASLVASVFDQVRAERKRLTDTAQALAEQDRAIDGRLDEAVRRIGALETANVMRPNARF